MKKVISVFLAAILGTLSVLAAPQMVSTVDGVNEIAEVKIAQPETGLVAEESLGEVVFAEDFSSYKAGASLNGGGFAFSQKTTPAYGTVSVTANNAASGGEFAIAAPMNDGNNMIEIKSGVSYPQIRINFNNVTTLTAEGTYTLVVRYYIPTTTTMGGIFKETWNGTSLAKTKGSVQTVNIAKKFSGSVSKIEIQSGTVSGGSWYIDSLELYYKAPGKKGTAVIIGDGIDPVKTLYDVEAGDEITMPTLAEMADYVPGDKILKGFEIGDTFIAIGGKYTVTAEDIDRVVFVFNPVFENVPDMGYGEMVFFEDFEGMSGSVESSSYLNTLMRGTFKDKKVQTYNRNTTSTYEIASPIENGTKMLYIKNNETPYPQIGLVNLNLDKPGTYTIFYDYYFDGKATVNFIQSGIDGKISRHTPLVKGKTTTVTLTKTVGEGEKLGYFDIQTGAAKPGFYIDNIRIYYYNNIAPNTVDASSIRISNPSGIRFVSFANYAVRTSAAEYGFLFALKDDSITDYETKLVFADGERTEGKLYTNSYGINYLFGANYVKDTKDIIFSTSGDFLSSDLSLGDDGVYYTAVMYNIPESGYTQKIVVRPYVVINEKIYYGDPIYRSIYEVALSIKNSEEYVENEYIEKIISTVENA